MKQFDLPSSIGALLRCRNELRDHYARILKEQPGNPELSLTFDGKLVGDIGEALAVEIYGIRLVQDKSNPGIDGYTPDGKTSVQVKATGTGRGPAFRNTEIRADHLLFFDLDFENLKATVVFNGPEDYAFSRLPMGFRGQRSLSRKQIERAELEVPKGSKLAPV